MIPGRRHLVGPALGLLADRHLAEPPLDPHPLEHYSALMHAVGDLLHDDRRAAGLLHAAFGLAVGATAGTVVHSSAVATFLAADGHRVRSATTALVEPLALGQVETAREQLLALGLADPVRGGPDEIAGAAIGCLAANLTDAVVAPAFWGVLAGAPGVLACRAVTALGTGSPSSGRRDQPFDRAGARARDAATFAPERVTVALVILARPSRAAAVWHAWRGRAVDAESATRSVSMTAFAAALGLELDGATRRDDGIDSLPGATGRTPTTGDIAVAARLAEDAQLLLALSLLLAGTIRIGIRALRGVRRRGR